MIGSDESEGDEAASKSASHTRALARNTQLSESISLRLIAFVSFLCLSQHFIFAAGVLYQFLAPDSPYTVRCSAQCFRFELMQRVDTALNMITVKHVFVLRIKSVCLS